MIILFTWGSQNSQIHRNREKLWLPRGEGKRKWGVLGFCKLKEICKLVAWQWHLCTWHYCPIYFKVIKIMNMWYSPLKSEGHWWLRKLTSAYIRQHGTELEQTEVNVSFDMWPVNKIKRHLVHLFTLFTIKSISWAYFEFWLYRCLIGWPCVSLTLILEFQIQSWVPQGCIPGHHTLLFPTRLVLFSLFQRWFGSSSANQKSVNMVPMVF